MVPGLCFLTFGYLNSWGFTQPAAAGGGKGLLPNVVRAMPCQPCVLHVLCPGLGRLGAAAALAAEFCGGNASGLHTGCTAVVLLTHPTRAPLNDWCVFIVQAALTFLVYETIMKHLAEAQQRPQDQKG